MNPLGFALAGAIVLTSSLAAFDAFGRSGPSAAEVARSEPAPAAVQARPAPVATAEAPRRAVRVILSSPYDVRG